MNYKNNIVKRFLLREVKQEKLDCEETQLDSFLNCLINGGQIEEQFNIAFREVNIKDNKRVFILKKLEKIINSLNSMNQQIYLKFPITCELIVNETSNIDKNISVEQVLSELQNQDFLITREYFLSQQMFEQFRQQLKEEQDNQQQKDKIKVINSKLVQKLKKEEEFECQDKKQQIQVFQCQDIQKRQNQYQHDLHVQLLDLKAKETKAIIFRDDEEYYEPQKILDSSKGDDQQKIDIDLQSKNTPNQEFYSNLDLATEQIFPQIPQLDSVNNIDFDQKTQLQHQRIKSQVASYSFQQSLNTQIGIKQNDLNYSQQQHEISIIIPQKMINEVDKQVPLKLDSETPNSSNTDLEIKMKSQEIAFEISKDLSEQIIIRLQQVLIANSIIFKEENCLQFLKVIEMDNQDELLQVIYDDWDLTGKQEVIVANLVAEFKEMILGFKQSQILDQLLKCFSQQISETNKDLFQLNKSNIIEAFSQNNNKLQNQLFTIFDLPRSKIREVKQKWQELQIRYLAIKVKDSKFKTGISLYSSVNSTSNCQDFNTKTSDQQKNSNNHMEQQMLEFAQEKERILTKLEMKIREVSDREIIKQKQDQIIREIQEEKARQIEQQLQKQKQFEVEQEFHQEKIRLKEIEEFVNQETRLVQKFNNRDITSEFELIYQQEDNCLSQTSLKILINREQLKGLLLLVKQEYVKTIGFFGDFEMSLKILREMYPKATKLNYNEQLYPQFDRIIGFFDGQNMILVYQNSKSSFKGGIYENDDGLILIRYLLDTCSIIVACLNNEQIYKWSDNCPYETFPVSQAPKIVKDRSTITCKLITTKQVSNQLNQMRMICDNNGIIPTWISKQSEMLTRIELLDSNNKINQNKAHILNYVLNIESKSQFDKKIEGIRYYLNSIERIFIKSPQQFKRVTNIFEQLQKDLIAEMQQFRHLGIQFDSAWLESIKLSEIYINILDETKLFIYCCEYCRTNNVHIDKGIKCCSFKQFFKKLYNHLQDKFFLKAEGWQIMNREIKQDYKQLTNQQFNKIYQSPQFIQILERDEEYFFYNNTYNQGFKEAFGIIQSNFQDISFNISLKCTKQLCADIILMCHALTFNMIKSNLEQIDRFQNTIKTVANKYLEEIDKLFYQYSQIKEFRIEIEPLTINFDETKNLNYISPVKNLQGKIMPGDAHEIISYISYDENVDYLITCNSRDRVENQKVSFWMVKRKGVSISQVAFNLVFSVPGNDISFFINKTSKQWVIFNNIYRKGSIGKINFNYNFEEGRLTKNLYEVLPIGSTCLLQRIDSCIILNDIESTIFIYEKQEKTHYSYSLSGILQIKEFKIKQEINCKIEDYDTEIISFCNDTENEIYFFETPHAILITNPNYIIKKFIPIDREQFKGFKLVQSDSDYLLLIQDKENNIITYVIQDSEDQSLDLSLSSIPEVNLEDQIKGNIVLDKLLRSVQHYGNNFTDMGCPHLNYLCVYYEGVPKQLVEDITMQTRIRSYMSKGFEILSLTYNLTFSNQQIFDNSQNLIRKIATLNQSTEGLKKSNLYLIMFSRIPIQISTIQQSSYIPLKDGLFQKEFLEINGVESQVEFLKNSITLGWFEDLFYEAKRLFIISICGRQSVGKSSQLNRMFGTRFGVSAARCTDGVWLGYTKIGNDDVIILDCEGLFSIRRTDDEEVKLLEQISLISTVSIVFCDLEGVNQPLLDLFKKLQNCVGKRKGEGIYFKGTLLFLTKNVQDGGDKQKIEKELDIHLKQKQVSSTINSLFGGGISYGYLLPFLSKEYNSKLKEFRDKGIFEYIIKKKEIKHSSKQVVDFLKYSIAQIYLDDDTDVELISIMDSIKNVTEDFKQILLDLTKFEFPDEKLRFQFTYESIKHINQYLLEYEHISKEQSGFDTVEISDDNSDFQIEELKEEEISLQQQLHINASKEKLIRESQAIKVNMADLKLQITEENNFLVIIPQNRKTLEILFQQQFQKYKRFEHNNFYTLLQTYLNQIMQQRIELVFDYFEPRLPKQIKFSAATDKYKAEFKQYCLDLSDDMKVCMKVCKTCDKVCIKKNKHRGDCSCETDHECIERCSMCPFDDHIKCYLSSGHNGAHICNVKNHLCGSNCEISKGCKISCRQKAFHGNELKHSCLEKHFCLSQCRLYDKCGKTCNFLQNHDEEYHICDSKVCFDKCMHCGKQCQVPLHDHDLLLKDPEANSELLQVTYTSESGLTHELNALHHLCGEEHPCTSNCNSEGVCKIKYEQEEKIWENFGSDQKFPYIFFKPIQSANECQLTISKWKSAHEGDFHNCKLPHRCDAQCPECQSFCKNELGHDGYHSTTLHRNKENCIFINESEVSSIKIKTESKEVREYKAGDLSTPETCQSSCFRQGRAHVHLKVCEGGDKCAEKTIPNYAKHSSKTFYPRKDLIYDEILCKSYWEHQGWNTPLKKEDETNNTLCRWACFHESHKIEENTMNYCNLKAWHSEPHNIDRKSCLHSGFTSGLLDICFTIDTTGSMSWAVDSVKSTIPEIIKHLKTKAKSIMFALVCYKDHPPQDSTYASKIMTDLTDEPKFILAVNGITAGGGGDGPESVMDGLSDSCKKISWRKDSQRFLFHIGDAPPHGKQYGCTSSDPNWTNNGCPCGIKKEDIAKQLREKEIGYILVSASTSLNMMSSLFQSTFGINFKQHIDLKDHSKLNFHVTDALLREFQTSEEFYHVMK